MVIYVIIYSSKPTECSAPRMNPNINYGLCVIMMCQHRFINCNKWTTLMGVLMGEAVRVWGQGILGNSTQFCYEPKTALKKIKSI